MPKGIKGSRPLCSSEGCTEPHLARGFCNRHYKQWQKPPRSMADRFWAKVNKTNTCWIWTGKLNQEGYGELYRGRRLLKAHRYAYELLVGPIPEGKELDHVRARGCTSKACVKVIADEHGPAHLEPVTHHENCLRGRHATKTHCKRGHPFDAVNTGRGPNGTRRCRACKAQRERQKRAAARAARERAK